MNRLNSIAVTIFLFFCQSLSFGQQDEKIWFSGLARSYFARDVNLLKNDTISSNNYTSGYNLIDLNTHINPLEDIEVFAQLRIRNEFGSFFGSGTQIDVRQLTVKGVLGNKVKFSIGDLFLKQNKFTLYNNEEELYFFSDGFASSYRDVIHYENFYLENRWRLQGLQTNFSYEFDRFVETLEFDFFVTRPRGSYTLGFNTTQSDMVLSGASMISKISKKIIFESNYINLFEIPSTGNINISVRNPVIQGGLTYVNISSKAISKHHIQSGFSKRSWLQLDSLTNKKIGMFSELSSSYLKNDSSFSFSLVGRYVDPNFRSSGSQTRRINMSENNLNSIYTYYSNEQIQRPLTAFDIVSDPTIYNQDISPTLMSFNPMYSNALPYGDATPNRAGIFSKFDFKTKNKFFELNFKNAYLNEVIGQGTKEKRNFLILSASTNFNLNRILNFKKHHNFSFSFINEITNRGGNSFEMVDLNSKHFDFLSNIEIVKDMFFQIGLKQVKSLGNEFLTKRVAYGEILTFNSVNYKQTDNLYSLGINYKFSSNVYINVQYNWWETKFNELETFDFKYQRLLFIFSVKL